jgi:hypothetical protein
MRFTRTAASAILTVSAVALDARPAPFVAGAASITLVSRGSGADVLQLEGRRSGLEACASRALEEDPESARSIGYALKMGPNGAITSVELTAHGPLSTAARACFTHLLGGALFDPPDGGGRLLEGDLILGDAPPPFGELPFPPLAERVGVADLPPIRLRARPAPPEARATDAAVAAARGCAPAHAKGMLRVRLVATDAGIAPGATVGGDVPRDLVGCVQDRLAPRAGARLPAHSVGVAVDVELVLDKNGVRLAR